MEIPPERLPQLIELIKKGVSLEALDEFMISGTISVEMERILPMNLYRTLPAAIISILIGGSSAWSMREMNSYLKITGIMEYPFVFDMLRLIAQVQDASQLRKLAVDTKEKFFPKDLSLERFKEGVLHHTPSVFHPMIEKAFQEVPEPVQGASAEA